MRKKILIAVSIFLGMIIFLNSSYAIIEKVQDENIFQNTPAVII